MIKTQIICSHKLEDLKASPKGAQSLGNYQESRIRHLHLMIDKYLNN